MLPNLSPWIQKGLDILFPPTCVSCEADGDWWCETCQHRLRPFRHTLCPGCGSFQEKDHACTKLFSFTSLIATGSYGQPELRTAITAYKYRSVFRLEDSMTRWLKHHRDLFLEPWPWAGLSRLIVTSIPGDQKRVRERGMDHTARLASIVRRTLVPWAEEQVLLTRTRRTSPNAQLPTDIRREANVRDSFRSLKKIDVPVLLIDDVFTTGATVHEATKILLVAGAPQVHVFVLAKGG